MTSIKTAKASRTTAPKTSVWPFKLNDVNDWPHTAQRKPDRSTQDNRRVKLSLELSSVDSQEKERTPKKSSPITF